MPRQTSFQMTEATERQMDDLKAAGFGTTTDVIRIAIDRMYQQERNTMSTNTIYLSENNAGGLLVGNERVGWYDFTMATEEVSFEEIAQALIDGDTDGWTIERYDHHEQFENDIVAEYTPDSGTTVTAKYLGIAASQWLGIEDA